MDKDRIRAKLKRKRERLALYIEREKFMLSKDGVLSYGVGSRSLQRYNTALADIRKAIEELEDEIEELEALLDGGRARKAAGVVPRDW